MARKDRTKTDKSLSEPVAVPIKAEKAGAILRPELRPNCSSTFMNTHHFTDQGADVTSAIWTVESASGADANGTRYVSGVEAEKIGAGDVQSMSNGKYVRFEIRKWVPGPRSWPDPYLERFAGFEPPKGMSGIGQRHVVGLVLAAGLLTVAILSASIMLRTKRHHDRSQPNK